MNDIVSKYVKGCVIFATSKPSNTKLGLYIPLPFISPPWESVSIYFVGGLPVSIKGHDYFYAIAGIGYLLLLFMIDIFTFLENFGHLYGKFWTQS